MYICICIYYIFVCACVHIYKHMFKYIAMELQNNEDYVITTNTNPTYLKGKCEYVTSH